MGFEETIKILNPEEVEIPKIIKEEEEELIPDNHEYEPEEGDEDEAEESEIDEEDSDY